MGAANRRTRRESGTVDRIAPGHRPVYCTIFLFGRVCRTLARATSTPAVGLWLLHLLWLGGDRLAGGINCCSCQFIFVSCTDSR